jgi:hypothetical protein
MSTAAELAVEPLAAPRPGLEYQHAFDLIASGAAAGAGAIGVRATSGFYSDQLRKRLGERALMFGAELDDRAPAPGVFANLVWAAPAGNRVIGELLRITERLEPGGRLWILAPGLTACLLPEHHPGEGLVWLPLLQLQLRLVDLRLEAVYGFHGVVSVLWSWAARLAERAGRLDLADRCLVAMRQRYLTQGPGALLAPLVLVVARQQRNSAP